MQLFTNLRRIIPVITIVAMVILVSSCASNKKYGCPNHLEIPSVLK